MVFAASSASAAGVILITTNLLVGVFERFGDAVDRHEHVAFGKIGRRATARDGIGRDLEITRSNLPRRA